MSEENAVMTIVQGADIRVTSLQVAETFGKQHKNVLRDVEELSEKGLSDEFCKLNFEPSSYTDASGKSNKFFERNPSLVELED